MSRNKTHLFLVGLTRSLVDFGGSRHDTQSQTVFVLNEQRKQVGGGKNMTATCFSFKWLKSKIITWAGKCFSDWLAPLSEKHLWRFGWENNRRHLFRFLLLSQNSLILIHSCLLPCENLPCFLVT